MRRFEAPRSVRNRGPFPVRLLGLAAAALIAVGCTSSGSGFTSGPTVGAGTTAPQSLFAASAVPSAAASAPAASASSMPPASLPLPSAASSAGATGLPSASPIASATPAPTPTAVTVAYPLTLIDDEKNQVVLKAEPRRIVSITPATTEILFALDAGDRLIANTDADDYPPQVVRLPHVATYSSVDVEKIVGLNADLVIAGGNGFNKPDSLAQLRRLGIPVLVVYGADVEGVLHDINLIAQAVGRPAQGAALVAEMRAQFTIIQQATANLAHPRTFYELDATKEIYGPADQSFIAEMISLAGGTPITTGSATVFSIPLEKLVAADPEVIILGDAAYGTTAEIAAARPGWATMSAVRNRAIRPIDDTVVTRPGPRLVEGLRNLALAIHPGMLLPPLPSVSPAPSGSGPAPASAPASTGSSGPASAAPSAS